MQMNTKFYKKEACNKQYKHYFFTHDGKILIKNKEVLF